MARVLFSIVLILLSCLPRAQANAISLGSLGDWKLHVTQALRYLELEYDDEGLDSMTIEERAGAMYVIAYFDGIRDGGMFYGNMAYSKKYGAEADFDPALQFDEGFCMEDSSDEVIPKLDRFLAEQAVPDSTDFLVVLMRFLETEYACD